MEKLYTARQMKMICDFKLNGYSIQQIIDDTHAKIIATNGVIQKLLFKIHP